MTRTFQTRGFRFRSAIPETFPPLPKGFRSAALAVASLFSTFSMGQGLDVQSDTWVCHDGLGREVASADAGVTRTTIDEECQTGIFYYVWHGQHGEEKKDITRLLEEQVAAPAWGEVSQFHWGSKPVLGYYRGGTDYIIAKHMQMLVDAGIDFYFFDLTNAFTYDDQIQKVMNEIARRTRLGLKVPKLVFCCHSGTANVVTHLYNKWYVNKLNDKYWFYWNGKPLILIDSSEQDQIAQPIRDYFTMRHCWAWEEGENRWPWLAYYPQKMNYSLETGQRVNEQMTVAAAMHPYSKIGKSYHGGREPAINRYGLTARTPYGDFFEEQFSRALAERPRVLMITQWNEWMAQRFLVQNTGQLSLTRPGATAKIGETYFVDIYNQEFSRDIEPCADPLIRDNYYLQMVSNLRKYRGARPIPVPTVCKTIDMTGDFTQWDEVTPEFRDEPGDVEYTDATAMPAECLIRKSHDIVLCKVTKDVEHIFFYARTRSYISMPRTGKTTYMNVLINADTSHKTGWEGYDYKIGYVLADNLYYLYAWDGISHEWKQRTPVNAVRKGNQMMYQVRRSDLGLQADIDFDFKWIDNTPAGSTEILDFIPNGDCAPNARFNYRYKGSQLTTPTDETSLQSTTSHPLPQGEVRIYDLRGRLVQVLQRSSLSRQALRALDLPRGTYVAQAGQDSRTRELKFSVR